MSIFMSYKRRIILGIALGSMLSILLACHDRKPLDESNSNNKQNLPAVKESLETPIDPGVSKSKPAVNKKDIVLDTLVGRWLRPDGNYILQINSIEDKKKLEAQYFNPRPIHVERAEGIPDQYMRIFIEFNDVGYEGSSYDLKYDPDNDALVGKYYQATYGQTYQIAFIRLQE